MYTFAELEWLIVTFAALEKSLVEKYIKYVQTPAPPKE